MKKNKISLLLVAVFMFSLFSSTAFAVPDDSILSQHIKEADGTTGQDTNTGSGIKTGHIQDGAVTTGKIEDGSVTTPKITDNAVTTPKVADGSITTNKVVDGAITTPKIVDGTVSTSKIADGAVTDAKITGPISSSKLGNHAHNGADITDGTITTQKIADGAVTTPQIVDGAVTDAKITGPISGSKLGTHTHSGSDIADGSVSTSKIAAGAITPDKVGFYNNVIIVAPSGGDFTSPVDAMNAITDASASNPYLVKIMPGVYNIGTNMVNMKSYVDIEGSGENTTKIIGSSAPGPIMGASNSEIRFLTVQAFNTEGGTNAAIINAQASPRITNVTVITNAQFGILNSYSNAILTNVTIEGMGASGVYNQYAGSPVMRNLTINASVGIYNNGSSPVMENIMISGGHTGIWNYGTLIMRNVAIDATYAGVENFSGGTAKINNSMIKGSSFAINSGAGATTYVGSTMLDGQVTGNVTCAGVYDENYAFYPNTCPTQ